MATLPDKSLILSRLEPITLGLSGSENDNGGTSVPYVCPYFVATFPCIGLIKSNKYAFCLVGTSNLHRFLLHGH